MSCPLRAILQGEMKGGGTTSQAISVIDIDSIWEKFKIAWAEPHHHTSYHAIDRPYAHNPTQPLAYPFVMHLTKHLTSRPVFPSASPLRRASSYSTILSSVFHLRTYHSNRVYFHSRSRYEMVTNDAQDWSIKHSYSWSCALQCHANAMPPSTNGRINNPRPFDGILAQGMR